MVQAEEEFVVVVELELSVEELGGGGESVLAAADETLPGAFCSSLAFWGGDGFTSNSSSRLCIRRFSASSESILWWLNCFIS